MSFAPEELERYARHIVLREIGGPGQRRLKAARVLVVGAGGLGSPALLYRAAAGVGAIDIVDNDTVSLSNLQRQVLHETAGVGRPKVESAAEAIARLNPHVQVETHELRLDRAAADRLCAGADLVVEGSDNFATRAAMNAACVGAEVPLLSGALSQWEGQVGLYDPARGGACYACLFPEAPAEGLAPSCAEGGVVGALPGVVGALLALEAVKLLARAGEGLRGRLLIYDALDARMREIRTRGRADCAVCGGRGM